MEKATIVFLLLILYLHGSDGRTVNTKPTLKNINHLADTVDKSYANVPFTAEFDENTNDVYYAPDSTIIVEEISEISDNTNLASKFMETYQSMVKKIDALSEKIWKSSDKSDDILERLTVIDCSSLPRGSSSGVYSLYPSLIGSYSVKCFCDMDINRGNWTVILNRIRHESVETALNFTRSIRDYKIGFGDPNKDFWVGLENLHQWTKNQNYEMRIELEDFSGNQAYALYDTFYVDDEYQGYRLHVNGYSGNAGDSLTNWGSADNYTADGMMFSTFDVDRDTSTEINCSRYWKIGGWWFNRCSWANLMGPYQPPPSESSGTTLPPAACIGINWHKWRNQQCLRSARMMIRPSVSH